MFFRVMGSEKYAPRHAFKKHIWELKIVYWTRCFSNVVTKMLMQVPKEQSQISLLFLVGAAHDAMRGNMMWKYKLLLEKTASF